MEAIYILNINTLAWEGLSSFANYSGLGILPSCYGAPPASTCADGLSSRTRLKLGDWCFSV